MDCDFAVKVSMLIDGELPEAEAGRVKAHLDDCDECRRLEQDFLFFRAQLKAPVCDAAADSASAPVFAFPQPKPLWKRGISLPAPVFAGLIFILIGLTALVLAPRFAQREEFSAEKAPNSSPKPGNPARPSSLARFDKGGRAELYVARQDGKTKR